MSGTPRLRSRFPSTPDAEQKSFKLNGSTKPGTRLSASPLPQVPQSSAASNDANSPLIPFDIIDAPSQRLYAFAVYVGLAAWGLYDWYSLVQDDAESFWLFIKWTAIDGVFFYCLPGMRIPWLDWSNSFTTVIFLLHAFLNGMLMFRVPVSHKNAFSASP
jgi:nucleoporin POM152